MSFHAVFCCVLVRLSVSRAIGLTLSADAIAAPDSSIAAASARVVCFFMTVPRAFLVGDIALIGKTRAASFLFRYKPFMIRGVASRFCARDAARLNRLPPPPGPRLRAPECKLVGEGGVGVGRGSRRRRQMRVTSRPPPLPLPTRGRGTCTANALHCTDH